MKSRSATRKTAIAARRNVTLFGMGVPKLNQMRKVTWPVLRCEMKAVFHKNTNFISIVKTDMVTRVGRYSSCVKYGTLARDDFFSGKHYLIHDRDPLYERGVSQHTLGSGQIFDEGSRWKRHCELGHRLRSHERGRFEASGRSTSRNGSEILAHQFAH